MAKPVERGRAMLRPARIVRVDGTSHFLPMEYPYLARGEINRLAEMP